MVNILVSFISLRVTIFVKLQVCTCLVDSSAYISCPKTCFSLLLRNCVWFSFYFCFLGSVITDLEILRLLLLILSITMVRSTLSFCSGYISIHFPEVIITSYLLRVAVMSFSSVIYSLSP